MGTENPSDYQRGYSKGKFEERKRCAQIIEQQAGDIQILKLQLAAKRTTA